MRSDECSGRLTTAYSLLLQVTCILAIRGALFKHFVVGGWDRNITCFEDPGPGGKESYPGRVLQGHKVREGGCWARWLHKGHCGCTCGMLGAPCAVESIRRCTLMHHVEEHALLVQG